MPFRFPTLAAAVRAVATAAALVAMARPVTAVAQGAPPTDRLVVAPACGLAGASAGWARRALSLAASAARNLG